MVKQSTKSTTISYEKQHQVLKNYATLQPPKIPCNKYFLYLKTMLPIAKKEKPNMSKNDIMLEIRHRWKMLSDDEKLPYTTQYEKNMKEYRFCTIIFLLWRKKK